MTAGVMVVISLIFTIRRTIMPEVCDRVARRWSRMTGRENLCPQLSVLFAY